MNTMNDSELMSKCFNTLVANVGYLGTERFIVMMNRSPGDYTDWRKSQFNDEGSIEELGQKIRDFSVCHP